MQITNNKNNNNKNKKQETRTSLSQRSAALQQAACGSATTTSCVRLNTNKPQSQAPWPQRTRDMEGGDLAAGGPPPAGELLTGNIGSLRELAATKSASRSLRTYTSI
jgi:hypothetical protein